jgi:hypothetical protein
MAEFKVEILKENNENEELKYFLSRSENCTIFHRPNFLAYHDKNKFSSIKEFSFYHFIFRNEKNEIAAFIPGAIYSSEEGKKIFKSPFYSSYGGIVFDDQLKFEDLEKILDLFIEELKAENTDEIYFTQTAECYCGDQSERNNYVYYILKLKRFELTNLEMILVKKTEDDILISFHNTIQRQIKQALRNGLEFRAEEKITAESYKLLEKSQARLGGKPTHSFEELNVIRDSFPENIVTFSALHNDKIIAGIIGFLGNQNTLNTFYIFDDEDQRELKGMQFTYYNVLIWAKERGIKYVDFGPATFGLKPHYSLINYKEKYGSIPMLRNTYSIKYG